MVYVNAAASLWLEYVQISARMGLASLYRVHARVNLNVLIVGVAIYVREKYFEKYSRANKRLALLSADVRSLR